MIVAMTNTMAYYKICARICFTNNTRVCVTCWETIVERNRLAGIDVNSEIRRRINLKALQIRFIWEIKSNVFFVFARPSDDFSVDFYVNIYKVLIYYCAQRLQHPLLFIFLLEDLVLIVDLQQS